MFDVHNYPQSCMVLPKNNGNRISVLGEFGGLGWAIQEHLWDPKRRNWGYKDIDGALSLMDNYTHIIHNLENLIAQGLAAAIYTQTTDVEAEVNGLITYDREIIKLPVGLMHLMNDRLYRIKPANTTVLIADGQNGTKNRSEISVEGQVLKVELPYVVGEKATLVAVNRFSVDKAHENLSLWLNMSADVVIRLNGVVVFEQNIREFRQYTHFSLSDYAYLLRQGTNELTI